MQKDKVHWTRIKKRMMKEERKTKRKRRKRKRRGREVEEE